MDEDAGALRAVLDALALPGVLTLLSLGLVEKKGNAGDWMDSVAGLDVTTAADAEAAEPDADADAGAGTVPAGAPRLVWRVPLEMPAAGGPECPDSVVLVEEAVTELLPVRVVCPITPRVAAPGVGGGPAPVVVLLSGAVVVAVLPWWTTLPAVVGVDVPVPGAVLFRLPCCCCSSP